MLNFYGLRSKKIKIQQGFWTDIKHFWDKYIKVPYKGNILKYIAIDRQLESHDRMKNINIPY